MALVAVRLKGRLSPVPYFHVSSSRPRTIHTATVKGPVCRFWRAGGPGLPVDVPGAAFFTGTSQLQFLVGRNSRSLINDVGRNAAESNYPVAVN